MMNFKNQMQRTFMLFATVAVLGFTGCPDYSHQRPVPNYDEMIQEDGDPPANPEDDPNADI